MNLLFPSYWIQLLWVFLGGGIIAFAIPKREELVFGKPEIRWRPIAAFIFVLPYIVWTGFRENVGDTGLYKKIFNNAPSSLAELPQYMADSSKDVGYSALTVIFKSIFGNNSQLFFLLIGLASIICITVAYRKYSPHFWFSFFLFFASADYVSWLHNGMRQFLVAAILFAAIPLILKRKYIWLLVIIVLSATVHLSILIMIPVILIAQGKTWNWKTWVMIILVIALIFFVDRFTGIMDNMLEDTQYADIIDTWASGGYGGVNPLRALVFSIPAVLSFFGRRYLFEEDSPLLNLCTNMSIITTGLYIVAFFTSGLFVGRLTIYCSLYNYILLPWEIEAMFTKESARLIYGVAIVGYLIYFYYQMHFAWNML